MATPMREPRSLTQAVAGVAVWRLGVVLLTTVFAAPLLAQEGSTSWRVPVEGKAIAATASPTQVIYTNLAGQPNAQVPGLPPGTLFAPGSSTFDTPFGSPNGHWILTALTNLLTNQDEVVIVDGLVLAQEGTPTGVPGSSANIGVIDTRVFINDAGDWGYATDTDAPTNSDEMIIRVRAGVPEWAALEGQPAPGIPGASLGPNLKTPVITASGFVGYNVDQMQNVPAGQDDALLFGGAVLSRSGVSIPTGQIGAETMENFDADDFWMSADGSFWLTQGDLNGPTTSDDVVLVRHAVVVQEGAVLPASGFADPVDINGIEGVHMTANARWYVRGTNAVSNVDWIYSNGAVLTKLGDAVAGLPSEVWSDIEYAPCFFMNVGDARGNYVIGGVSNGPTASNGMLVLNQTHVVARESDPIDLDGNGLFDDGAFFHTFANDHGMLADSGLFYFVANIKNGAGAVLGQGFFVAATPLVNLFANGFE